ncbi:uncharacterized protein RCC_00796 [Ramularia collo-cygni]|uniref:SCP domain-containing protein n=1 Tax=Ramularia collo-cygni TaxID=112498 RepID=A0A2D3UM61_9PEZI|nr:uncharacterized protein RCC_00796 [Ramularia collo-cygni]CZT14861.1 uncharacterized protein RCC_00796 [Ramularia collo-cygni]
MHWTLAISALAAAALAMPQRRQEESTSDIRTLTYNETVVFHHNLHRANHSSVNITWDEDLASTAQKIADICNFEHNMTVDGGNYGQNLAVGMPAENISYVISDLFYNLEAPLFADNYNMAQPPIEDSFAWGHFTQLVWNSTTRVGCATQHCTSGVENAIGISPHLTVCNYKSAGNVQSQYASNIGEPLGHPIATWANSTGVPACELLDCTTTPAQNES